MSRRATGARGISERHIDQEDGSAALIDALVDSMDAPVAVITLPTCEVERASEGFPFEFWGGTPFDHALPAMAEAFASGSPPPSGVEWRPVDARRMLVIHRRPERDDAIAALQRAESDTELAEALGRLALAEGADAAQVLSVDAEGQATVLSTHGRTAYGARRLRSTGHQADGGDTASTTHLAQLPSPELATDGTIPTADSGGPFLVKRVWSGRAPEIHLRLWGPMNGTLHALEASADRVVQQALPLIARQRVVARLERATAELSERNAAFRAVLDTLRDPLWLVDRKGVVLLSNDAATNLSEGHLSNLTQLSRRAADERSRQKLLEPPREGRIRVQLQAPDGFRRLEFTVTPLDTANHPSPSFVVVARDITREANRLRGLEALVRVAQVATRPLPPTELASALTLCVRKHFRLDTVALWLPNDPSDARATTQDAFPKTPLAASGDHDTDSRVAELRYSQAFSTALTSPLPAFVVEGEALHAAVGFTLHSGARGVLVAARWRPEDLSLTSVLPYRHPLKVLARIVAQALDVALIQDETNEARAILSAALAALPDAVLVTDDHGRVRTANEEARRLVSRALSPVPDLATQPYADDILATLNVREASGEALAPPVREALRGRPLSTEVHLDCAGRRGSAPVLRQAVLSSIPLAAKNSDEPTGAVVVVQDVSRQRELERMKDTFLSMAAHELRTPLAAMKAYAQHTKRTATQLMGGDKLTRSLSVIERQTDRMHTLVSDLLEVSKLVAGSLALNLQPADLGRLVHDACEHLAGLSHQHDLHVDVQGRLWAQVDAVRSEQVLTNLVSNAIRYSPGGGRVDVRAFARDDEAVIEVCDEGIGIAPERAQLIFDRFYRAHDDPRLGPGGLGLGLWIAREIVLRHGGRIEVESQLGMGSTFRVVLPLSGRPQE